MRVWKYNNRYSCLIRVLSREQTLTPLHRRADWFQRQFGLLRKTQITLYLLELEPRFFGRYVRCVVVTMTELLRFISYMLG
jgi:hypothetical protein